MTPDSTPLYAPLSFGQEQWWLLDQIEPGNTGSNVAIPLRLKGKLDIDAIERIGNLWRQRHETLRTRILRHDGELQQLVMPYEPEPLELIDLSGLPLIEREATAQRLTDEHAQHVFDLRTDSPIRLSLLRMGDEEHIWLRTIHHIACDGWSVDILLREAATYYNALSADPSPERRDELGQTLLPLPTLTYRDYAHRQRADKGMDKNIAFWKERLRGAEKLPPLVLKPEQTQNADQTAQANRSIKHLRHSIEFQMEPQLIAELKSFCQQQHTTFFTLLLSAFSVLLHRIGQEDEFVIGIGIADRHKRDTQNVVGFFVNTLPLRHQITGDPSFAELLGNEHQLMFEAFTHSNLPIRRLIEQLAPTRRSDETLLFQSLVVAIPTAHDYPYQGLVKVPWEVEKAGTIRGLLLHIKQVDDSVTLNFDYDADYFDRLFMERFTARYEKLLRSLPSQAQKPLSQLDLLSKQEQDSIERWENGEHVIFDGPATLHELVAEQAVRTPEAIALQDGNGQNRLSYAELDEQAKALAFLIQEKANGSVERVAIFLERSPQMAVAALGTLYANAAVIPLDPTYPASRLQALVADARPHVLLTTHRLYETHGRELCGLPAEKVVFLDDELARQTLPATDLLIQASEKKGENLAYILYTSGSTGTPKGVAMPHRALVNLVQWQMRQTATYSRKAARTLQFAPLSFDVAWQEIFSTWAVGGTLVMIDEATRRAPELLLQTISDQSIERLFVPYVALQQLAWAAGHRQLFPQALREIISAGEQLLITPQIRAFFQQMPACVLHNHYGPTETHVVTSATLQDDCGTWPERPSIGHPIANAHVTVVDENGKRLPIGLAGEIQIAGTPVAQGYWNAPELTHKRFGANSTYRTGDLGRWCHNGELEYLGRNDDQIKIRGYRVEPGDIENALLSHYAITEAAVIATTQADVGSGQTRLTAYLVIAPGSQTPENAELKNFLQAYLPEYMIPSAFITLNALPLTPSGKINRRQLEQTPSESITIKNKILASVSTSTFGAFEDGKL
jgi:amino acid adenylation domain-containing protein